MNSFTLIPFTLDNLPVVEITGRIERQQNQLNLEYYLTGSSKIILPEKTVHPARQFDLWEHTCFEFFLGLKDSNKYWEFNLSPAKHWNVFRFLEYRQNIAEEMAFDVLPFQVWQQDDCLRLNLKVDLNQIITPEQSLAVGITAVIKDKNKQLSYWALSHPAKEADFHLRDSFIVNL